MTPRAVAGARRACFVASLALACAAAAPPSPLPLYDDSASIDGVAVRVTARDGDEDRARAALAAALVVARDVAARLLVEHEGSEVDVLMHVPSHVWIGISDATAETLERAFAIADATDGAYDPTSPPLLRLWGVRAGDTPRVPRAFEVDTWLRRVDFTDVRLERDDDGWRIRRMSRRTELDLGAFARGAMLDAALETLRDAGVPAARASTVAEHAVYGGTDARPWEIELLARSRSSPGAETRVGRIDVREGAVAIASQGPTRVAPDGTEIHDRFDARTGYPVQGTHWVATEAETAAEAAGWADALFAVGQDAPKLAEETPHVAAVVTWSTGAQWQSSDVTYTK